MTRRRIFVFGSNLAGRHGKGAAKTAVQRHGAIYGKGSGMQGDSYAIPTKDAKLRSLTLDEIKHNVRQFLAFARANSGLTFYVTPVGCGLAGYKDKQVGPMFEQATLNCQLPIRWQPYLPSDRTYTFYNRREWEETQYERSA
jgi:hypothetical protein